MPETVQSEKKFEKDIDMLSKVTFLDSLLDKQTEIRNMLDVRANIVIGFNSALIILFATRIHEDLTNSLIYLVPLVIFGISLALAIIALKPPHYSTKKGQGESLFYHHYIESKPLEEYRKDIYAAISEENKIYDAYITEVYNLTKYSNIPRKFYLYASIRALIFGIIFAIVAYGLTILMANLA